MYLGPVSVITSVDFKIIGLFKGTIHMRARAHTHTHIDEIVFNPQLKNRKGWTDRWRPFYGYEHHIYETVRETIPEHGTIFSDNINCGLNGWLPHTFQPFLLRRISCWCNVGWIWENSDCSKRSVTTSHLFLRMGTKRLLFCTNVHQLIDAGPQQTRWWISSQSYK